MALKFDGKYLKDGNKTLCRVEGNNIRDGHSGSITLCHIQGNNIKDGHAGSNTICRVEGDNINDGHQGNTLIKTSDAARKIGATSLGPTTAAMWYKFCR